MTTTLIQRHANSICATQAPVSDMEEEELVTRFQSYSADLFGELCVLLEGGEAIVNAKPLDPQESSEELSGVIANFARVARVVRRLIDDACQIHSCKKQQLPAAVFNGDLSRALGKLNELSRAMQSEITRRSTAPSLA